MIHLYVLPMTARVTTTLVVFRAPATFVPITISVTISVSIVVSSSLLVRTRPLFPFLLPFLLFFVTSFLALTLQTNQY